MIKEIVLNKKYKALGQKYTRTPLCIHNGWVFYEHNCYGDLSCSNSGVEEFKCDNEEIPEAPEDWFEVVSFQKNEEHPYSSNYLYKSKESFLKEHGSNEEDYHWIKLKKVEL